MDNASTRHRSGRRAGWVAAAIVSTSLIAAACGASNPSAADYSNQANTICQTYSAKLRSVTSELALSAVNGNKQGVESQLSKTLALVQQGATQLEGLARPTGEAGALKKAFDDQTAQLKDLRQTLSGIRDGNTAAAQKAEAAFEQSEAPLNQQFDVLGMTSCGSGVAPPANGTK
jgi:hypothetical protein